MKLAELTWPQVETYLKSKKTVIVPVGSTEQHGPTGVIGIDFLTALKISEEVGETTNTLVAPPVAYGMALHHMAFPGTVSLTPTTFIAVIVDIIKSFAKHGFEKIIFVNGHGGNIAPLTSAFSQYLQNDEKTDLKLINWWHLKEVTDYENEHFKGENGFHATVGEISVTMHTHPNAYSKIEKMSFQPTAERTAWPLSPTEFKKIFTDGRMNSNPALASAEHGKKIFDIAVNAIINQIKDNFHR